LGAVQPAIGRAEWRRKQYFRVLGRQPGLEAGAYTVTAQALAEPALQRLARTARAEPVAVRSQQFALHRALDARASGRSSKSREASVVLELRGGERQALVLSTQDLAARAAAIHGRGSAANPRRPGA
jgi:hypothetical protein